MQPESPLTRRSVLAAALGAAVPPYLLRQRSLPDRTAPVPGIPGPFRGRVVEIGHSGAVVEGKVQREAVAAMMARGMCDLTGVAEEAGAWKRLFGPGDIVGVKLCAVGRPLAISQPETLREVFRGLNLAGVPNRNIILFNRYEDEAVDAGLDRALLPGIRWGYGAAKFDPVQTSLEGYDPDVFVEMNRVLPGQDPDLPASRRSHVCKVVTQQVTKVVNVGVLKDHASAGITMALKNMSHGLVNNVSRSHASATTNWCDTFIPDVVGNPVIRQKVVLQIGDGLIGVYDGGPGNWNPHFRTWEYRSLFFATDPVAMDRIGWRILDAQRTAAGLPPLAETGSLAKNPGHEGFANRQPQHVELAGAAGLGEADLRKIDHRRIVLGG